MGGMGNLVVFDLKQLMTYSKCEKLSLRNLDFTTSFGNELLAMTI